jgi:uncharacterized protein YpmB
MEWLTAIAAAIKTILDSFMYMFKKYEKSPAEKEKDAAYQVAKEMEEFKNGGRPQ